MGKKNKPAILFVVYPGIKLLDLTGPLQVFSDTFDSDGNTVYRTAVASIDGGTITTDTSLEIPTERLSQWRSRQIDTLLIVGGNGVFAAIEDHHVISCIIQLTSKSRRVAAVCSGAFVLAECGLLNSRRAVTHWYWCDRLSKTYRDVRVEPDHIFLNDGKFWTSAGVTSGIDMAIKMVSDDHGRSTALNVARSLVTYLVRPGGQNQFSHSLNLQTADGGGRFDELHIWIKNNLEHDLRNQQLADQVNMSMRNFARLYLTETGTTPAKTVEKMRVEAACTMLEETNANVNTIATRCGFGDDERMRRAFERLLKTSPLHYRKRFSV